MVTVRFRRWSVDSDPERTREAHAQLHQGGTEECGCEPCRNFTAARSQILTDEFLSLLRDLGVDPAREVEIYHNARLHSGLHSYGGWFHAVGKIVSGGECWRDVGGIRVPELEPLSSQLAVGFQPTCALVLEPVRGLPLSQVELQADVPWVLSVPEPA